MQKPELIAPAGDLEKLKIAFLYGADSVYASTPKFSMRTREIGFTKSSLKKGIEYAHSLGKKVYLTINSFPHSGEIGALKKHIEDTVKLKPDALIVADPGVLSMVLKTTSIPIHLSTQANTTNHMAAEFWRKQGVKRIVLARELSIKDIKTISRKSKVEIEAFVHGAMCMAYSGRCQISNYLTGRDPNKGACVQACRFKYKMYELEEEMRKGERFPVYEEERGTYILNSKDLCMVDHIPELINAGITSFKLEGRLKSIYYVAMVTRAYRKAIDLCFANKDEYEKERKKLVKEVAKTSNRGFTTGFFFNKPDSSTNNYETSRTKGEWCFVGIVKKYDQKRKIVEIEAKNYLPQGSNIEVVTPDHIFKHKLKKISHNGKDISCAHAGYVFEMPFSVEIPASSIIRAKNAIPRT